ncbi:MAG: LCP family protein [Gemmatimonadales bacterium]
MCRQSRRAQISLQHGFGDGGEQSARLTADAVSKLFGGMPVDFYIALDMDAISTLNDALGGVEVKVEDDFSALDPAMAQGSTIRLTGTSRRSTLSEAECRWAMAQTLPA